VAADEVARAVLAAHEPAERSRVRQNDVFIQIWNQLAARTVFDVKQRQLVRDDRPLDESLHLDVEAVAGRKPDRVGTGHLEALTLNADGRDALLVRVYIPKPFRLSLLLHSLLALRHQILVWIFRARRGEDGDNTAMAGINVNGIDDLQLICVWVR